MPTPDALFVCGSLDPGRDGVGDYARLFAGECAIRGGNAALLSLADHGVDNPQRSLDQVDGRPLPVLRLPSTMSWQERVRHGRDFATEVGAQLLSLQFVPWSYAHRGVVRGLAVHLLNLGEARPWHVMCHELWIDSPQVVRHRLLGLLQRAAILRTLRELDPVALHASTERNIRHLEAAGLDAHQLAIFGAIPCSAPAAPTTSPAAVELLMFGSLSAPDDWPRLWRELSDGVDGHQIEVTLVGGDAARREQFARETQLHVPSVRVTDAGRVEAAAVDGLMSRCRVGYSRTSATYLGRSSSLAAFLEHGVPVWAPYADPADTHLAFRGHLVFDRLADAARAGHEPRERLLPRVVDIWSRDLEQAMSRTER